MTNQPSSYNSNVTILVTSPLFKQLYIYSNKSQLFSMDDCFVHVLAPNNRREVPDAVRDIVFYIRNIP